MEDLDIIMIYQTITVCSSLLHDKIPWLRFENESDTWYYSLLFWNMLFHAILKIWEWYFDISIYHFFKLKIWWRQFTEFADHVNFVQPLTDTLSSYQPTLDQCISRHKLTLSTDISVKYQSICQLTLDRHVGQYVNQEWLSDCRPTCQSIGYCHSANTSLLVATCILVRF